MTEDASESRDPFVTPIISPRLDRSASGVDARASSNKITRRSGVESLRLIAMLMILAHHFVVHNAFDVQSLPLGLNRFVLEVFFEGSGKVGVVVFFTISAWYLMDKSQSLRSSFLRIWEMEGTLLFYGLTLLLLFVIFDRGSLTAAVAVNSVFPLMRRCWWYTSAYAAFLLLLPFLRIGLLRIGRSVHLALALLLLAVWGGSTLLPGVSILKDDVFALYLLICCDFGLQVVSHACKAAGGTSRTRCRRLRDHRRLLGGDSCLPAYSGEKCWSLGCRTNESTCHRGRFWALSSVRAHGIQESNRERGICLRISGLSHY